MLKSELNKSVSQLKNPERRINVIVSILICSALWSTLTFVIWSWGNNLLEDNRSLKLDVTSKQRENDSLRTVQYQYVLEQLRQVQKVREFTEYQDSLNTELKKVKRELISK